jgi:hypothetical protein
MVNLYAGCLGIQFKTLKGFPETTQKLVQQVIDLPDELEIIKTINLYEIMKNLSSEMLRSGGPNNKLLIGDAVPMLYINRYKTEN